MTRRPECAPNVFLLSTDADRQRVLSQALALRHRTHLLIADAEGAREALAALFAHGSTVAARRAAPRVAIVDGEAPRVLDDIEAMVRFGIIVVFIGRTDELGLVRPTVMQARERGAAFVVAPWTSHRVLDTVLDSLIEGADAIAELREMTSTLVCIYSNTYPDEHTPEGARRKLVEVQASVRSVVDMSSARLVSACLDCGGSGVALGTRAPCVPCGGTGATMPTPYEAVTL